MMTRQEAIDLFREDDLIGIGMAADAVRSKVLRCVSTRS